MINLKQTLRPRAHSCEVSLSLPIFRVRGVECPHCPNFIKLRPVFTISHMPLLLSIILSPMKINSWKYCHI